MTDEEGKQEILNQIRDLRNELLGLPLREKLKSSAVPTKNLTKTQNLDHGIVNCQEGSSTEKDER